MALYDGLVEYGPKDQQPIPAVAKSWEISPNVDEFVFHLRDNAKWSDGTPITARDFVYSFRRGFDPETLLRTAGLGYAIDTAQQRLTASRSLLKKNGSFCRSTILRLRAKDRADVRARDGIQQNLHGPGDRIHPRGDEKGSMQIELQPTRT